MTPPFSDELISAYLDGELTPEQQTLVEQQLSQRADLRRMCDDLLLLRRTLQALPVAEPPDNLAERVLRQAERRSLAGELPGASPFQTSTQRAVPVTPPPARRPMRTWGVVATAVAAVAAVGLVMVVLPRDGAREVAQAPAARPESVVTEDASEYATDMEEGRALSERVERAVSYGAGDNVPSLGAVLDDQPTDRADPAERSVRRDALARGMMRSAPTPEAAGGGVAAPAAPRTPRADEPVPAPPASALADGASGMGITSGVSGMGGYPGAGAAPGSMGYPGMPAREPAGNEADAMYFAPGAAPSAPGMGMAAGRASGGAPAISAPAAAPADRGSMPAAGMPGAGPGARYSMGVEAERAYSEADLPARADIVEQIVSQLNQDQMLLVRVQLPERELSPTLVELSNSNRTNVLTAAGSVVPVEQTAATNGTTDAPAAGKSAALSVPPRDAAELRQLQLGLMTPNTVIVDGSSEQIRQSLNGLSTRRGVEIQPVMLEPLAGRAAGSQQLGDAAEPLAEVAIPAEQAQANLGKSAEDARTMSPMQAKAKLAEQPDVGEDKLTIIYLLLRLWNETTANTPAGPADNPP